MSAPSDSGGAGTGPGGEIPAPENWSEAETWAWDEIRAGRPADFHARDGPLDPKTPEGWDGTRKLGQAFLETLLLDEPYRGATPRRGVRIVGAWFPEPIDLANARVEHELWFDQSRFETRVDLSDLKIVGPLSLRGSTFGGTLVMQRLQVDSSLYMRDSAEFAEVNLRNAKVGGQLSMIGSRFGGTLDLDRLQVDGNLLMHGGAKFAEVILRSARVASQLDMDGSRFGDTLNMDDLQVDGNLFMRGGAEFAEVILRGAKVGGQLSMIGSKFGDTLNMDNLQVDDNLFMHDGAEFGEVNLIGAKVAGRLGMDGSRFGGTLNMESIEIGNHLLMSETNFAEPVQLIFATIKSSLNLSGAKLAGFDLTGARIAGELWLGSRAHGAEWSDSSELILRNTVVGALEGAENAWPESLKLEGFTYGRLGGSGSTGAEDDMAQRPARWFIDWLAKDRSFSPQPYQQLAEVFRAGGQTGKAHDILYAGRERERRAAEGATWWTRVLKWLGMFLLMVTIGYGLGNRYFRALGWVFVLVLLGAGVLAVTGEGPAHGMPWGLSYSLDHLLPVVQLIKSHYAIELDGFARYYFYVHKLMGYVLASFLIAGLAGLTQK